MAQNISKYVQLNDFILLEYIINKEGNLTNLSSIKPYIVKDLSGHLFVRDYDNDSSAFNTLKYTSIPTNSERTNWYFKNDGTPEQYERYYNKSFEPVLISQGSYVYDTIRIHVVSGYNFQDVYGMLLQLYTKSDVNGDVYLANFTWAKQLKGITYSVNSLYIGNKFYDKYIEFMIPSIYYLGNDWYKETNNDIKATKLPELLKINSLESLYINFSMIDDYNSQLNQYIPYNNIQATLSIQSNADNFNLFIAESNEGDYIEYYATWNDNLIGNSVMNQIETGQIPLYTSNDPNNNWEEFVEYYGNNARKWVIMHELTITEEFNPDSGLSSSPINYTFTQTNNFDSKQLFRPILLNSDLAIGFNVQYNCRLVNRMDGTQIIRSGSFSSTNAKKYGKKLNSINIANVSNFKVFNKSNDASANIIVNNNVAKTKYVKMFYNLSNIELDENNTYYGQGTYVLNLLNSDSLYKFKFITRNSDNTERHYLDLSGAYNYIFYTKDSLGNVIEVSPTGSTNMNLMLGELEFKLTNDNIIKMLNVPESNRFFSIMVKNPDKTTSTLFEGSYKKYTE